MKGPDKPIKFPKALPSFCEVKVKLSEELLLELLEYSSIHTLGQKKDGLDRLKTQLEEEKRLS